jgi:hypothetical protein
MASSGNEHHFVQVQQKAGTSLFTMQDEKKGITHGFQIQDGPSLSQYNGNLLTNKHLMFSDEIGFIKMQITHIIVRFLSRESK